MNWLNWLIENRDQVIGILTAVVTCSSLIAAATPSPKDDGWVAKIRAVVDFLALNFGHAKNADPKVDEVKSTPAVPPKV